MAPAWAIPSNREAMLTPSPMRSAVTFLDDICKVDANAKLDATLGGKTRIALDHPVLHLDGAANSIHNAAKLDEDAIASPLDDPTVMEGDSRIEQIAAERA
jgi:hypothetical protein